jgi:hypothetical protein
MQFSWRSKKLQRISPKKRKKKGKKGGRKPIFQSLKPNHGRLEIEFLSTQQNMMLFYFFNHDQKKKRKRGEKEAKISTNSSHSPRLFPKTLTIIAIPGSSVMRFSASHGCITNCLRGDNLERTWGGMALVLLLLLLQLFFTSFTTTTTTELQSATHSKHTQLYHNNNNNKRHIIYKQKCKLRVTDPAQ